MSDDQVDVIDEGPVADVLRENAVETPEDADDLVVETAFITDDSESEHKTISETELVRQILEKTMSCWTSEEIHNESRNAALIDVAKSVEGSTQSVSEIGEAEFTLDMSKIKVVEPPYPPELLSQFLEVDETHFRCCRTKVSDAVGREYLIDPVVVVRPNETPPSHKSQAAKVKARETDGSVTQEEIDDETLRINEFIIDCNEIINFEGVLDRAAMDYESIGWGAVEVIRSMDMKIRKLAHIPASRVRVLRGWKGFVEKLSDNRFVYYQPFGQKVVAKEADLVTGENRTYNPKEDGELNATNPKLEWKMVDRRTGKPTSNLSEAANELIWIPKNHSNTIYYGYTDIVSALGSLLANINIRDYMLQFFEHNTVPRFAITISGAKLSEPVQQTITKYFSEHVKGKAHKTLIVPLPGRGGEVKVEFHKLGADTQEGSFQETRKNNQQNIMTAHGVSPAVIGIAEAANLGSGKGLSQAEIYKDRIVTPTQRIWARHLNRMFRLGLGIKLVALKFNPLDIRDIEAESKVNKEYLNLGVNSINEVRKRSGRGDPVPGGDRPFILTPQGIMFIDDMDEATSDMIQEIEDELESLKTEAAVNANVAASLVQPGAGPSDNGGTKPAKPVGGDKKQAK